MRVSKTGMVTATSRVKASVVRAEVDIDLSVILANDELVGENEESLVGHS